MALGRYCIRGLTMVAILSAGSAEGLVIYRFGGQDQPPPPAADSAGVEFVRLDWSSIDVASLGRSVDLDLSSRAIGALRRDPTINIAPTVEANGGQPEGRYLDGVVWDGDTSTVWSADAYLCAEIAAYSNFCTDDYGTSGTTNLSLGSLYQLDRIRVVSGLRDPSKTVQSLRVYLAPSMPFVKNLWHPWPFSPWIVEVRDNREQVLDIPIPPHEDAGFVQVTVGEHNEDWEVAEVEVYARGFAKRSTYVSNVLAFDQPMAWGDIRWTGSKGKQADVLIQTRSGSDPDPDRFYRFTGRGNEKEEVSRAQYQKLGVGEKAGAGQDQDNWSFWSAPYNFADSTGTPVVSPGPRQYFQLRVDFVPQGDDGGQLRVLEFGASEPVATALVGEVWPVESEAGQVRPFTYIVKPTILGDDGFDRLEIRSLSLLGKVLALRIGDDEQTLDVEAEEDHRLVVRLRRLGPLDSGTPLEVDFEARVLRFGATFDGRVWVSEQPLDVHQRIVPGDATGEQEGNRVSVTTAVQDRSLLQVGVVTEVLTPNGDGVNDTATLTYEILEVIGTVVLEVEVWDLAGRTLRRLHRGTETIGSYRRDWDGRDDGDRLLPPGIYVARVVLTADQQSEVRTELVHVAH